MTDTISIINNDGSLEKISLCLQQESIPTFWIKCINLEALFKLILCFKILIWDSYGQIYSAGVAFFSYNVDVNI